MCKKIVHLDKTNMPIHSYNFSPQVYIIFFYISKKKRKDNTLRKKKEVKMIDK